MSDDLDFSELSDDQIVELAVALAREAMRRNPALQAAFAQALLDERERVEAAARGSARVKQAAAQRLEQDAERAELAAERERRRQRIHGALVAYLARLAEIIGRPLGELTLVWKPKDYGRGPGPRLQVNQGATGADVRWHLLDFVAVDERLYTSPGLRSRQTELLPWFREVAAVANAFGLVHTFVVKGIEA
ncbi:hypothetical protein [Xanthomonas albilineans]|uniref:Uncharacterized protein n=1 Tax=Xanthomonas albilineans (strain GPE PC73 / CFBP 7063) TaxID=380358 RepID=D2U876_XANAP|nr:hypothetical protein [Xanthomonas albilineans]CBA14778.1 hypothetical protein XALC_0233 [Xanthomonas albilineans GPE PC73]